MIVKPLNPFGETSHKADEDHLTLQTNSQTEMVEPGPEQKLKTEPGDWQMGLNMHTAH